MSAWVMVAGVAAGGLSGLFGPIRREPELYWSGLWEWCCARRHARYPRNWRALHYADEPLAEI